jgi:hypothetical protein
MRNKSRKRILHEQRVEIAKLRRELAAHKQAKQLVSLSQTYEPQKIEIAQFIPPYLPDRMIEDEKRRADREALQKIIEALARSEIVERTETIEHRCKVLRYRLIVMKRRH